MSFGTLRLLYRHELIPFPSTQAASEQNRSPWLNSSPADIDLTAKREIQNWIWMWNLETFIKISNNSNQMNSNQI